MKYYGSRFCRRCGTMFAITEPDDMLCARCAQAPESGPPAPPVVTAPKMAAKPPRPVQRERRASPPRKAPATRSGPQPPRNSGPRAGPRTLPMLRALAAAPRGLTTPQLAELASSASSWVNALGATRQLMLKQEKLGRVRQAGTAAGNRTRESAVWQLTGAGELYVREADENESAAVLSSGKTVTGLCLWTMFQLGDGTSSAEVARQLEEEDLAKLTPRQAGTALRALALRTPPLLEHTAQGTWRVTDDGWAVMNTALDADGSETP